MQKYSRWIKRLLISLLILLSLIILSFFLLKTSPVQNYVSKKIIGNLSENFKTKIEIGNIYVDFFDLAKIDDLLIYDQLDDTLAYGKNIKIDIGLFSLLGKKIVVDDIRIDELYLNLYAISDSSYNFTFLTESSDTITNTTKIKTKKGWQFNLDGFDLNRVLVLFDVSGQKLRIDQEKIKGSFRDFNIEKNKYLLSKLVLDNGNVLFSQNSIPTEKPASTFSLTELPIDLGFDALLFNQQEVNVLVDGNSYDFSQFNASFIDFLWSGNSLDIKLDEGNFMYNNELEVLNLQVEIGADSSNIVLSNIGVKTKDDFINLSELTVDTPYTIYSKGLDSKISANTLIKFQSSLPAELNLIPESALEVSIDNLYYNKEGIDGKKANIKYGKNKFRGDFFIPVPIADNSRLYADVKTLELNINQVKKIYPKLDLPEDLKNINSISFDGVVSGKTNNLEVLAGRILLDDKLEANFSGNIDNAMNPDSLSYVLSTLELKLDSTLLAPYYRPGLALNKLGNLYYSGRLSGDINKVSINGRSSSDLGSLAIDADFIFPNQIADLQYNGKFSFESFDLGALLENPDLGQISLTTNLDGVGLDLENLNSRLNAKISSFYYRGYTYQGIDFKGSITDCIINGNFIVDDKNAKFSFDGKVNLENRPFLFDFESNVDTIDFTYLNLDIPKFGISGGLSANFTLPIQQGDSGKIAFRNFKANDFVHVFREDSMVISLSKQGDTSYIDIESGKLNAHIDGIFRVLGLPSSFANLYNYYALGDTIILDSIFTESDAKSIHIVADIESINFLQFYDSEAKMKLKRAELDFNIDFEQKVIEGDLKIDSVIYDKIFVESAQLKTANRGNGIQFDLNANNVNYNNISLPIVSLKNFLAQKSLESAILIQDEDSLPKLKVGTKLYAINDEIQWKFKDSLVLNNEEWLIRDDNEIVVGDNKLLINNLVIYDKDEQMSIKSLDTSGNNVSISFEEFNIAQFVSLVTMEESKVSGRINGRVELIDLFSNPYFLANITLNNIVYAQKPVGSIQLSADENPQTGVIAGTFDLIGSRNDILGRGSFDPESRVLDWNIYAGLLEMRLLDPFLEEFISNSEGVIFGEAYIGGTIDKPEVNGEFTLEDIATTIDINNTRYSFENHLLTFDNQKIDIGSIELLDQLGNSALVTGRINHNYYSDLILDLELKTDKFLFLNTTKENNPIFYGKVLLNANVDITGPPDLLDVQVFAKSLDETSINLSPFSETESILKEEFIRYGKPGDFDDLTNQYLQKLGREYPFDVYLTLEANDESEFTFVVDPLSGDKLNCNGNGNLQINLDPYGDQEIYGRYTVSAGSYSFSYGDFINKKFKLTPGGTINFNGNPFNAKLDVKAVYTAYTTTYELIRNEVSLSDSEAQAAQRRTKVNVILSLSGSLMNPEITLDVEIPDLQSGTLIASIDRKLSELRNNPDELNNQVFGLLVFNSFILSESTTTDLNTVSQGIALSSISNLISNELNGLAQNVLRGVDVSIDVNSYNSQYLNEGAGGNITEVGLNVSKQLFNDRVKISAGGNLNFDNSVNNQNQFSTFIGDFVVEYKLNEKGNYRLRVFSRSNYDQLLNQNSSKTGVSLFFNKEFDSKIKED